MHDPFEPRAAVDPVGKPYDPALIPFERLFRKGFKGLRARCGCLGWKVGFQRDRSLPEGLEV